VIHRPKYVGKYAYDYLTHYTKASEGLVAILDTGLAKPNCDRPVLKHLGFPPFYKHIGLASVTEIPVEYSASHRAEYGNYGIAFTREWVERMAFQPVLYIPTSGAIYEHIITQLAQWRNEVDSEFDRDVLHDPIGLLGADLGWLLGKEPPEWHAARIKRFLQRYRMLWATDYRRMLLNFVEFDDLRRELEWRSISATYPYETTEKGEQIKEASAPLTGENAGWKFVAQNNMTRQEGDPFGVLMEGQLAKFLPKDVSFFVCPLSEKSAVKGILPRQYQTHEFRCVN
jgi:hypothetical protein